MYVFVYIYVCMLDVLCLDVKSTLWSSKLEDYQFVRLSTLGPISTSHCNPVSFIQSSCVYSFIIVEAKRSIFLTLV